MSLIDDSGNFKEEQGRLVDEEIAYWDSRREENETVQWAFTQHRKLGQEYDSSTNELEDWRRENVREYIDKYPDVVEVDGVIVDLTAIQLQYHCMHKSCKSTGKYCCSRPMCTSHTETSKEIMQEAGREYLDKYEREDTKARIRRGDTHTPKLNANSTNNGCCVFGEVQEEINPHDKEEYEYINCGLHEGAYEDDMPLHHAHSIGSSLFPADILIVDDKYFVTAAHPRIKEAKSTRWWTTADNTICVDHGDMKDIPILRHPDFDALYADILGRKTLDSIQTEAYGGSGAIEPEIDDGWMHAEERGLDKVEEQCDNCEGSGCDYCDGRGYFNRYKT